MFKSRNKFFNAVNAANHLVSALSTDQDGDIVVLKENTTMEITEPSEKVIFHPAFYTENEFGVMHNFFEALWMLDGCELPTRLPIEETQCFPEGDVWRNHEAILCSNISYLEYVVSTLCDIEDMYVGIPIPDDQSTNVEYVSFKIVNSKLQMTIRYKWFNLADTSVRHEALFEFVSDAVGIEMGSMTIKADGLYCPYDKLFDIAEADKTKCPYVLNQVKKSVIEPMGNTGQFLSDLKMFCSAGPAMGIRDRYLRRIASPIYNASIALENNCSYEVVCEQLQQAGQTTDWVQAICLWLENFRK